MKVKQFYDTDLAHASYAVLSKGQLAVIDPGRDPQPYYDYAREQEARIVAVMETHPHADFISSHLEIHQKTGATLYASQKTDAQYPHQGFDTGDELKLGQLRLQAFNTPGHSPDSISILLLDKEGRQQAVFTGDTLFVGNVGRPDLREKGGEIESQKQQLARQMFHSTRDFFMKLDPGVVVYPAHGAGSLCGRNISEDLSSTIEHELRQNEMLQKMSENAFVEALLAEQPYIPKYFKNSIALNKRGAAALHASLLKVPRLTDDEPLEAGVQVIDARDQIRFKNEHIKGALNLMEGPKFETWLGSLLEPHEPFYLLADEEDKLDRLIKKAAKIGYEENIKGAMVNRKPGEKHSRFINLEHFKANPEAYQVVDIRNEEELEEGKLFAHAQHIPLYELRERIGEVKTDKPVVVHCGSGYRSAAGFSILESELPNTTIYDLSTAVKEYLV